MIPGNNRFASMMPRVGAILWLAGCAVVPPATVDWSAAEKRFQSRHQTWTTAPRYWQVTGVMDLDLPEGGRRHRMTLTGLGTQQARLTIYGPFQQIAGELWLDREQILLLDPQRREIYRAAATEDGMNRLARMRLPPVRLLQAILAVADPPRGLLDGDGVWVTEQERLRLDDRGRLIQRMGEIPAYQAHYQWSDDPDAMPQGLTLAMGEGGSLAFQWKTWRFPEAAEGQARLQFVAPDGFSWISLE